MQKERPDPIPPLTFEGGLRLQDFVGEVLGGVGTGVGGQGSGIGRRRYRPPDRRSPAPAA